MTPEHITALAEACERVSAIARLFAGPPQYRVTNPILEQSARDADAMWKHAAALRAGRVTITEETTNEAHG